MITLVMNRRSFEESVLPYLRRLNEEKIRQAWREGNVCNLRQMPEAGSTLEVRNAREVFLLIRGASHEDIQTLQRIAQSVLGAEIPVAWTEVLKLVNGFCTPMRCCSARTRMKLLKMAPES